MISRVFYLCRLLDALIMHRPALPFCCRYCAAVLTCALGLAFSPGASRVAEGAETQTRQAQPRRAPTPRITSISPRPVVGSASEQWIAVHGRGFTEDFTVRFQSDSVDAHISARRRLDFVSAREVRVRATFGAEAAPWTMTVLSTDDPPTALRSNAYAFEVVAPSPRIDVMYPWGRVEEGDGLTLTIYDSTFTPSSVVQWNGRSLPTTPIESSDNPNALTTGLTARVPSAAVAAAERHEVRVYTPPPGGGLSPPKTLFVNPRPFYRTPWFYLGLVALLATFGAGVHRWRLKNLRERALERKVQERTEALQQEKEKTELQAERLREMDRLKSRFFSNVSHELRTPLTMIAAPLRGLLGTEDDVLPDAIHEPVRVAVRSAERLDDLVEQLLDLSRLEAGRLSLEPRPGELIAFSRDVTRAFAPLAERRGLDLCFRAGAERLPLHFDPEKLRTILHNLLSNALKFTPEGGKVVVRADKRSAEAPRQGTGKAPQETGDHAVVRVSDTGPGIPEDMLPHIFERFRQADGSATRSHDGLGIGLPVARDLAELHGGTLCVESEPGLGATFVLSLPMAAPTAVAAPTAAAAPGEATAAAPETRDSSALPALSSSPTSPPEPSSASALSTSEAAPPTVLIAEDDANTRAFLRQRLAEHYRVIEASNGAEALEKVRAERPALVMSDVMMPQMDGATLCRTLKDDDALRDVPVLLLTAHVGEVAQVEALEAGADAYVEKPFSMKALRARIENLIAGRRTLREQYSSEMVVEPTGVTATPEDEAFYQEARAVVEAHIGDHAFDMGLFAHEMGMGVQTKRQLRRRLKSATGLTPSVFLRQMRLERAAQLLAANGALRVYEVADAVGYRDAEHFSKRFREYHGVSPSQYPPGGGGSDAKENDT